MNLEYDVNTSYRTNITIHNYHCLKCDAVMALLPQMVTESLGTLLLPGVFHVCQIPRWTTGGLSENTGLQAP